MDLLEERVYLCYHSKDKKRGNDDYEFVGSLYPKEMQAIFPNRI